MRRHGVLLICDEVATGFGRTGTMFACEQERVAPDFLCLGKGLTGGYLPLAATLATERVYEGFLGAPEEGRTFFHGHTFTGNPLACAAALASLEVFEREHTLLRLQPKIRLLRELLGEVAGMPEVAEVRGRGFMVGIDLGEHDPALRLGHRVTLEARERGAIIRPLGDIDRADAAAGDLARPTSGAWSRSPRVDRGRVRVGATATAGRHAAATARGLSSAPRPPGCAAAPQADTGCDERRSARSTGVEQTLAAPATEIPNEAEVAFEGSTGASRDDVFAYVAGLLRDRSAAEDVTALAFERAYRAPPQLRPSAARGARGCSGSLATRRSTSCGAAGARRLVDEPDDEAGRRPTRCRGGVRRAALRAALAALAPRERELVALKFFAGLSNAEIAEVIGVSRDQRRHPAAPGGREAEEGLR